MLYSLPAGLGIKTLSMADEIKIPYADVANMPKYIEQYGDIKYVLCITRDDSPDGEILKELRESNDIACELEDVRDNKVFKDNDIPFFWKYPATTFYEAQALKEMGAAQILVEAPLFFNMKKLKKLGMKIRVVPNVCYEGYLIHRNGLHGSWIRPQDVDVYEDYVYMMEFQQMPNSIAYAQILDVYKNEKKWVNSANSLFKNFDLPLYMTAIPDELAESRLNCGQRCEENGCRLCDAAVNLGYTIQREI